MDDRREKSDHSRMGPLLGFAVVIFVAYPLSIGLFAWLMEHGYIAKDNAFIGVIYQPIGFLFLTVPGFGDVLFGYLRLWVPVPP